MARIITLGREAGALAEVEPGARPRPGGLTAVSANSPPPVLVLGSGLTALGVFRLLGRAGYTAFGAGSQHGIERWSRYWRALDVAPGSPRAEEDLEGYLSSLPFRHAVLIPCSDDWVLRVAELTPPASIMFPASIASADTMRGLIDKWQLSRTLRELGLPHPATTAIDEKTDPATLPEPLSDYFIKPHDSARFFPKFGVKAIGVSSRADLAAAVTRAREIGVRVELQRYVPGPPENHFYVEGFVDRDGAFAALFLRRRLRMFPRDFGNSTYFESIPADSIPDAVQSVKRLLGHVNYRGIFSTEVKRDAATGICHIIDVNARPWWFVEFAGQCGVDVCSMAVQDALGLPVSPVRQYRAGLRCVYPYYDLSACVELRREKRLSLAGWMKAWLLSTQPEWRWTDPLPAIASTVALGRGWIGHKLHRKPRGRRGA